MIPRVVNGEVPAGTRPATRQTVHPAARADRRRAPAKPGPERREERAPHKNLEPRRRKWQIIVPDERKRHLRCLRRRRCMPCMKVSRSRRSPIVSTRQRAPRCKARRNRGAQRVICDGFRARRLRPPVDRAHEPQRIVSDSRFLFAGPWFDRTWMVARLSYDARRSFFAQSRWILMRIMLSGRPRARNAAFRFEPPFRRTMVSRAARGTAAVRATWGQPSPAPSRISPALSRCLSNKTTTPTARTTAARDDVPPPSHHAEACPQECLR